MASSDSHINLPVPLVTLCAEQRDVNWVQLGLQLNVPPWKIETIRLQHQRRTDEARCLQKVLDWWMKQAGIDVTWERISIALKNTAGRVNIVSDVGGSLIELIQHFAGMTDRLKRSLYSFHCQKSQLGRFRSFVANTLDTEEIVPCQGVNPTFVEMMSYTNPFQIDVVKLVIHGYFRYQPQSQCRQCITLYERHLQRFQRAKVLSHLKDEMHLVSQTCIPPEGEYDTLTVVLHMKWLEYTLKDLEHLTYQVFGPSKGVLLISEIIPGLDRVAFVFKTYFREVIVGVIEQSEDLLYENQVMEVIIGKDSLLYEQVMVVFRALSQNCISAVQQGLPHLTSVQLQRVDDNGRNLLHVAVSSNNVEQVKLVLSACEKAGGIADKMKWMGDKDGDSPMLLAINLENVQIFNLIFDSSTLSNSPMYPLQQSSLRINQNFSVLLQASLHNNLQVAGQILGPSFGNPVILYKGFNSHFDIEFSATLLEYTIPLVVVGDSGVGKSSLIKSLQVQGALPWLKHFLFAVPGADTHKAGIIPTHFDSIWFGKVVFFDLSSHREFVHEAILNCGSLVDAVYLIVVNLTDSIEKISQQIVYWLDFVHYHHSKLTSQSLPNVIVVGSHLHDIKLGRPLANRERFRDYAYPRAMSNVNERHFNIVSKAMMDCRKTSPENALLRYELRSIFNHIRQARQPLPSKCYILYDIIKVQQPETGAITVGHLVQTLQLQMPHCKLFDGTAEEVLELCEPLVQLNLLLLLKNEKDTVEETWIVSDSRPNLSMIERTVFHTPLHQSNSFPFSKDGILNQSNIAELFSELPADNDLLIQLMIHYKYCEVTTTAQNEKVYFFPHLLQPTLDIPPWEKEEGRFMFAWTLAPESHYHYFMPHLIHHFLLQLSQAEELGVERFERATRTLAWGDTSGVEVVVHIHSSKKLLVSMRSTPNQQLKCLKLRKAILKKVIEIMKSLESNEDIKIVKSLIPFQTAGRRFILPFTNDGPSDKSKIRLYNTDTIKKIIINRESISVRPSNYALPLVSIDDLLFFEPYYHLDHHLRERLYQSSDEVVTEEDYHDMGMALGLEKLFLLLDILEIDHTIHRRTPLQGVIQGSYIQLMGQKRLTYRDLRATLDSVSFFELEELMQLS